MLAVRPASRVARYSGVKSAAQGLRAEFGEDGVDVVGEPHAAKLARVLEVNDAAVVQVRMTCTCLPRD